MKSKLMSYLQGLPTEKNNVDMNLNTQILIAAILGFSLWLPTYHVSGHCFCKHSLYGLGILSSVFIGLLKMLLVPLIF